MTGHLESSQDLEPVVALCNGYAFIEHAEVAIEIPFYRT